MALLLKLLTTEKYRGGNWLFKSNCEHTVWPDDLEKQQDNNISLDLGPYNENGLLLILEILQNLIKKKQSPCLDSVLSNIVQKNKKLIIYMKNNYDKQK